MSEIKLFIVGPSDVGRTSILRRFMGEDFSEEKSFYQPNEVIEKTKVVNGSTVHFTLLASDVQGGTLSFAHLLRGANGGFIVYDCTNQDSFDLAKLWYREISRQSGTTMAAVFVANKCDLLDRAVTYDDGNAFAIENDIGYADVSAKTGNGVNEMLTKLVKQISDSMNMSNASSKSKAKKKKRSKCTIL